jgi:TonB family protein
MNMRIFQIYTFLITALTMQFVSADEEIQKNKDREIHFSQATKIGNKGLEKIVKIAAYDNKHSDIKKAIETAKVIQTEPDFSKYSHVDLAQFYSHLGWLHAEDGNLPEAIKYYTLALDNRSPYDNGAYRFSINQLLATSVNANRMDDVYNALAPNHFPCLSLDQMLMVAELYSQSLRFDLAEKIFSLADEESKKSDDYQRYLYFATYIKHATLHKRHDVLEKIADQYANENKTIKWSQLIAWKKNFADQTLPIKKIPPLYPRSALARGINGYVIAEYTVDIHGKTKDISIVEAYPEGYFEKESIKAAKKFLYKPNIGPDGVLVERHNVRNRFTFYMTP